MEIVFELAQGRVPVTVMHLHGQLDASNYHDVIASAQEKAAAGTRDLLVDMSDVPFLASSGLIALHSLALIMGGAPAPDPEHGWGAFRSLARDLHGDVAQHCKLLNPQPAVVRTLEITGFRSFVEVYTDRDLAVAAF